MTQIMSIDDVDVTDDVNRLMIGKMRFSTVVNSRCKRIGESDEGNRNWIMIENANDSSNLGQGGW